MKKTIILLVSMLLLTSCGINNEHPLVVQDIHPITAKLYNKFDIYWTWCRITEIETSTSWIWMWTRKVNEWIIGEFTIRCDYDVFLNN